MACENKVGVELVLLRATHCISGKVYGPLAHDYLGDDLPMFMAADLIGEADKKGYVKAKPTNPGIKDLKIARSLKWPLEVYQSARYSFDVTIRTLNGLQYDLKDCASVGEVDSNSHEVTLELRGTYLNELRP